MPVSVTDWAGIVITILPMCLPWAICRKAFSASVMAKVLQGRGVSFPAANKDIISRRRSMTKERFSLIRRARSIAKNDRLFLKGRIARGLF